MSISLEPPYGVIWDALRTGQVVPFLGAGASLACRQPGVSWNPKQPECLPSGAELSRFLAQQATFPSDDEHERKDLAKVASYYADVSGRPRLRQKLREVFNRQFRHGSIHQMLAKVPAHMLIMSTNYDRLLECAFEEIGRPYDLVIYPSDRLESAGTLLWRRHGQTEFEDVKPNHLDIDLQSTTVIYKMHGTVEDSDADVDSFVITEEDYVEFLGRMTTPNRAIPAQFVQHCRDRSFLFLGYSLTDWNLRVVLRNIAARVSNKQRVALPSWAIDRDPSQLEQILWDRRHVNIFKMSIEDFVTKMTKETG